MPSLSLQIYYFGQPGLWANNRCCVFPRLVAITILGCYFHLSLLLWLSLVAIKATVAERIDSSSLLHLPDAATTRGFSFTSFPTKTTSYSPPSNTQTNYYHAILRHRRHCCFLHVPPCGCSSRSRVGCPSRSFPNIEKQQLEQAPACSESVIKAMATLTRRPLSTKSSLPQLNEPRLLVAPTSLKRSRSPEPSTASQPPAKNAKRVRSLQGPIVAAPEDAKSKKKSEREQQKAEFREKYTKAFPSWIFYFDPDTTEVANAHLLKEELERKICLLGGRVEDFFSKDVTHLITDVTLPASTVPSSNKENVGRSKGSAALASLRSPIKLRVRPVEESANSLLVKAQSFGQKIWTIAKLSSVVDRCLSIPSEKPATSTATSAAPIQPSLSRLLQSERLNGTCERDPAEKRHDYRYFPKDTYFVLVEDLRQEYATIAVQEYPIPKPNSSSKPSWPILHCHPNSRNPFVEFDEKEKRRWEKAQQAEAAKREDGPIPRKKVKTSQVENLRRTVSMNSLRRHASHPNDMFRENNLVDLDAEDDDHNGSNYASGYLLSGALGHAAASGNSVTLTSTTGTTSTTSTRSAMQLSAPLRNRLQQHITTSKKFPCGGRSNSVNMGPPDAVPRAAMLRKSKSTNTMRLPKRDEGMKPGYCESCRSKFDDFRKHVQSTKHKRFAANDDNFLQLDYTLTRVKRRTLEEVKNNQAKIMRRQYAVGDP